MGPHCRRSRTAYRSLRLHVSGIYLLIGFAEEISRITGVHGYAKGGGRIGMAHCIFLPWLQCQVSPTENAFLDLLCGEVSPILAECVQLHLAIL
jgi:hypothetical protein